eukprot:COSAG02_NODE_1536_length_12051_cov_8.897674_2_plen_45_part_00
MVALLMGPCVIELRHQFVFFLDLADASAACIAAAVVKWLFDHFH